MSQALIEKLKKARQSEVTVGKHTFVISRPTDLDMALLGGSLPVRDVLKRYVVGWKNVTELDLVPGGMPDAVPFDVDLFVEWAADQPDIWNPIGNAIRESYLAFKKSTEQQAKN